MKPRNKPVIIVKCEHNKVFWASVLKAEFIQNDVELFKELEDYAKQGYTIEVVNADEYKFEFCECLDKK